VYAKKLLKNSNFFLEIQGHDKKSKTDYIIATNEMMNKVSNHFKITIVENIVNVANSKLD
jgi:hypothetical protein